MRRSVPWDSEPGYAAFCVLSAFHGFVGVSVETRVHRRPGDAATSFDVHIGMDDVPHLCVIMPVRSRRLAARDTAAKRCRAGLQRDAVAHRGCSGHAQAGPRYVICPHRAPCPPEPSAIVALVLQAMAGGLN
jgi:hypothetical protein